MKPPKDTSPQVPLSQVMERLSRFIEGMRIHALPMEEARKKYGQTLIRVNWMYADEAHKNPGLKQVCTWSDGDEGFVRVEEKPA